MDPNLVSPAGFQATGQETGDSAWLIGRFCLRPWPFRNCTAVAFQHLPMGNGLAAAFTHRHAVSRARVAIDRAINPAMRAGGRPPNKREIAALERRAATAVIGELCSERRMRAIVLRHHHEAGRILVEPVYGAGPALAADAGEAVAAMGDQGIDQRTGPVAGGGMNDETSGLFDDDDVVVLVNHGEWDRLRTGPRRTRRRHVNLDGSSGIDPMAGIADRMPV